MDQAAYHVVIIRLIKHIVCEVKNALFITF